MTVDVKELSRAALDVRSVNTDWTEGWGERWEYAEAPDCPACGSYGAWLDHEWQCPSEDCENYGCEIVDECAEGPMMNYRYPLPYLDDSIQEAASKISDLPLCVVEYDGDPALALTGGGMDLSWEICAAFIRLGFLPPVVFAGDLPRYAGGPRIPEILPACREALAAEKESAEFALSRFDAQRAEEKEA